MGAGPSRWSVRSAVPPAVTSESVRAGAEPARRLGTCCVGISIVTAGGTALVRTIGWVLPPLMALAVVATANHYVVDVAAGIALALLGYGCALLLERRRARRAPPVRRAHAPRIAP